MNNKSTLMPKRALPTMRHDFPIFQDKTYINSCSYGALSNHVRAAFADYLDAREAHGSPWPMFVEKLEQARAQFAAQINANPDEVAITTSASQAIGAVATGIRFDQGREEVLVTDFEFPTSGENWFAQEARGARVRIVKSGPSGFILPEDITPHLSDKTAVVAATHVCYRNGFKQDIAAVTAAARDAGAVAVIDGFQCLGTEPLDVKALNLDIYIGGASKYMLATSGLCFMYVRKPLIEKINPLVTGWFAQSDVFAMNHRKNDFSETARRFDAGTPSNVNIMAAIAGMELIEEAGLTAIQRHVLTLNNRLKNGVRDLQGRCASPDDAKWHGAMITIKSKDENALVAALEEEGIITSCRDGNLRVSAHLYNNQKDIDAFLKALENNRSLLA